MSFVIATPEMLTTAATDLAKIGSTITAANTAAAAVAKVLPASADEVSVAVAALFGTHAQEYQTVSAKWRRFMTGSCRPCPRPRARTWPPRRSTLNRVC